MASSTGYLVPEIEALVPGFLKRRDHDLALVESLLDQADLEAIALIAHRLKGNGSAFGFPQITALGTALETAAKSGDINRVEELVRYFREILHVIRTETGT